MKTLKKKISMVSIVSMVVLMLGVTAFAASQSGSSLGHANDKFEYGLKVKLLKGSFAQYSEFYCADKKHTATARMKYGNNKTLDEDKTSAAAKTWAKAITGYHTDYVENNSYYSHVK
ncbi:MAG: hypothetical protein NC347_09710 [Clostridium sp.]|nr:hypothetical protein [Clostridium sp.]